MLSDWMISKDLLKPCLVLAAAVVVGCSGPGEDLKTHPNEQLAHEFVDNLTAGEYPEVIADMDSAMSAQLNEDLLAQIWTSLTGQFGLYVGRGGTRRDTLETYELYYVTMNFQRASVDAKVVIGPGSKVAGLFFVPTPPGEYSPPAYIGDLSFTEEDIKFGDRQWLLSGTLTIPDGDGPFPTVILIPGSGPTDRDETVGSIRPFKDIAWGLGSRGIAVLRFDKRTRTHGEKFAAQTNYTVQEEVIDDVLAARDLLSFTPKIDRNRVFGLGHSLGGMLLPRIGMQFPDMAGMIFMAANTQPLGDMILAQTEYLLGRHDSLSAEEQFRLDHLRAAAVLAKSDRLTENTPADSLPMNVVASYWIDLRGYRPQEVARELNMPMLFLQGERDYQVPLENFRDWQNALSDRNDVTFRSFPALNHLFVAGEGQPLPDEYFREGHVAEEVIDQIAVWIKSR